MRKWIADRLKSLKKNKSGLAAAIGKPPARVTDILKGERRFQEDEWVPAAAYLEMEVEELLNAINNAESIPPPDAELRELQEIYRSATPDAREDLLRLARRIQKGGDPAKL
jgi:hypothetical protein